MARDHYQKERVYKAMQHGWKTSPELCAELQMSMKALQNHLRFLLEHYLIRKKRNGGDDNTDLQATSFSYIAADSSDVYTFDQKVDAAVNGTPEIVGRCDFAASWVPRQPHTELLCSPYPVNPLEAPLNLSEPFEEIHFEHEEQFAHAQ